VYIVVSIGNSDDKLTQKQWSEFAWEMDEMLRQNGKVHFFGGSPNWMRWQNTAWIIECDPTGFAKATGEIEVIRKKYNQESAFVLFGQGHFI
jgi:hypothetical protein